jgi:hypothetical protein
MPATQVIQAIMGMSGSRPWTANKAARL